MDQASDESTARIARTLEYEMSLVREAILMVAGGASPRVTVAGLHFGEALLTTARGLGTESGVRLIALWMPDDAGTDIAVERIADE